MFPLRFPLSPFRIPRFFRRMSESPPAASLWRSAAYWAGVWLAITAAGMLLGILLGALIWVTVGTLAGAERTAGELLRDGADIGMRYARVWAGGIAIILCFVKAHEKFSFRAWFRKRFFNTH